MKRSIELRTGHYLDGRKEHIIVDDGPSVVLDELIRVHWLFFKKPYSKQRAVIRLFIWWGIRHYFKTLFQKDSNKL
jgi:hypothetical protein